jgi:hypothetical protein
MLTSLRLRCENQRGNMTCIRSAAIADAEEVFVRSSAVRPESHPFHERIGYLRGKTRHGYRKRL